VYVPYGARFNTIMTLHVRTAAGVSEAAMLASIRRELKAIDPQLPILSATTMELHRNGSLQVWGVRVAATMFSAFGALALLLATIGVYGLKAYDVSRRTREIGIRMALGAQPSAVVGLVMKQGLGIAAVGVAVGAVLALGAAKAVSGALYGVSFIDPLAWSAAIGSLFLVATLANLIPARRASIVDPSSALRAE
jgi:ABC-type antimicrobial peptide transport system permease subunit